MTYKSVRDLTRYFFELEEDFDLMDLQINGVYVWQYLRFQLFMQLNYQLGIYAPKNSKNKSIINLLKILPSLLFYSLFSNPLFGNYKKKILIFNSGRKTNVNGKLIEIYTDLFIEKENLFDFEIIEELTEFKHKTVEFKNRKHQDYQFLRKNILKKLSNFKLSKSDLKKIEQIESKLKVELSLDVNLKKQVKEAYLNFNLDYDYYFKLLKKRQPKQIFIVCSYDHKMALVAAAKHLNVESIELQHGTISSYHLGYSYPVTNGIKYFPDKFYAFGEYWKNVLEFPINKDKIEVYGFPYFNIQFEHYYRLKKINNQLLVISQGTIGPELSKLFYKHKNALAKYNIVYKLHPAEYSRWKQEYKELVELNKLDNFSVIDNNEVNLYQLMAESEYAIGVYSTAIYEALAFKCKVVIINLPGSEYLDDLIDSGSARKAENVLEAIEIFNTAEFKSFSTDYFFASESKL